MSRHEEQAREIFQQWLDARMVDTDTPDPTLFCDDPDVMPALMALIDQFREVDEAMPSPSRPAVSEASPPTPPQIARYQILQVLGHGGMGEVWEAEQQSPVRRQVALKVIKRGLDTDRVVTRFASERQALAAMEHPTIAKVFDAGATDDGRPYFAMELVRGQSITAFCDHHRLETRERLQLFIQVCEGVQHAHQKGLIHRDLKPSNVLVSMLDSGPQPKIIDFGIAKAMTPGEAGQSAITQLGQLVGTPAYMSPEQADLGNPDVDTRTDVFSLGVLLYELLVGVRPFDTPATPFSTQEREREPKTPSSRITALGDVAQAIAERRSTNTSLLARGLRGDIDWIVLKAIQHDRERRYASPAALADDIARHFRDEPVVASPPSVSYRFMKFARRLRVSVTMGIVVLLALGTALTSLAVGLGRALRAEQRATKESEISGQVTNFLESMFASSDPTADGPGEISARELLDRGVAKVDEDLVEQPLVRASLLETMARAYRGLGRYDDAVELAERARPLRETEPGQAPLDLAASWYLLADLYRLRAQYDEATHAAESGLALRQQHLPANDLLIAESHQQLGVLETDQGNYAAALPRHEQTIAIYENALGPEHPKLAPMLNNFAILHWHTGTLDEAQILLERGLRIFEADLGPDHPNVASNLNNLALVLDQAGKHAEAADVHRKALAIRQKALDANHPDVAETLNNLGSVLMQLDQVEEAYSLLSQSLSIRETALGPDHYYYGTTLFNQGRALVKLGKVDEGRPRMERALVIFMDAVGPDHAATAYPLDDLAELDRQAGNYDDAERQLSRALTIRENAVGDDHPLTILTREKFATLLGEMGRDEEALALTARNEALKAAESDS